MRTTALVALLAFPLVLAGCGASGPTGDKALKTVKGDWEFNHDIAGHDELKDFGEVLPESHCQAKPDASNQVRCELRVHSAKLNETRTVPVVVTFDSNGAVERWDLR